jgi:hypothetical protein
MKSPKWCHVYLRNNGIIVATGCTTDLGVGVMTGPAEILSTTCSGMDLGIAIIRRIAASKEIPTPTEYPAVRNAFLKSIKIRSWKAFVSGAKLVSVDTDGNQVRVVQFRESQPQSFEPVDPIGFLIAGDPDSLGVRVLELLTAS